MPELDYRDITERLESIWGEVAAATERCERKMRSGGPLQFSELRHLTSVEIQLLSLLAVCHAWDDLTNLKRNRNEYN